MTENITRAKADFLSPQVINTIQRAQWAKQADYVNKRSQFYQRHFAGRTLTGDLDEIVDLPFTDKEMLRADQHEHAPFGSYLAASTDEVTRMHRTSGTTGTAMNLALTEQDARMTAIVGGRAQSAAGVGGSTGLIQLIKEMKIDAISCTPSYPAVLEQVLAKEYPGLAPRDLGLKLGLFGGEAGLDDPAFRQRLENTWGFEVRNSNYGVTDILCNFAGQSTLSNDLHFVAADVLYAELIEPETGSLKPWQAGETGELVLTHLCKQAQPLVRFRTNDIIRITATDKAACGRTATRFRVIGRSDDMVVVRGINAFPTMIAAVINQFPELSTEYRISLKTPPPYDFLPVEIELARTLEDADGLVECIQKRLKQQLGITARVQLLAPGSLPRSEGKTKRVVREY